MEGIPEREMARRIRTAAAWSNKDDAQIAKDAGLSYGTYMRLKGDKTASSKQQTESRIDAIADACGVPRWVLRQGLPEAGPEPEPVEARLDAIVAQLADQAAAIARIEGMLTGDVPSLLVSGADIADQLTEIQKALGGRVDALKAGTDELLPLMRRVAEGTPQADPTTSPRTRRPRQPAKT